MLKRSCGDSNSCFNFYQGSQNIQNIHCRNVSSGGKECVSSLKLLLFILIHESCSHVCQTDIFHSPSMTFHSTRLPPSYLRFLLASILQLGVSFAIKSSPHHFQLHFHKLFFWAKAHFIFSCNSIRKLFFCQLLIFCPLHCYPCILILLSLE